MPIVASPPGVWKDAETDLMLRVQRDEPGAFAELVRLYWTRVFARVYRCLRDRQEAEDLAQDVFLRLFRSRKTYLPKARFTTWLFHITHNVARNALRSRKRRPLVAHGSLAEDREEIRLPRRSADRQQSPSQPMERRELAAMVHAGLAGLGGRQRVALELHQFQQQTYVEIAAAMNMSPKAAKSLLYRARNQLRENLSGVFDEG